MISKLPDAEIRVMNVIWDFKTSLPTKTILTLVNQENVKKWSVSTLQTLLNRLVSRGFLLTERQGKDKYYSVLVSKEEYLSVEVNSFISVHYNGAVFNLVMNLFDSTTFSDDQIKKLRDLLNEGNEK